MGSVMVPSDTPWTLTHLRGVLSEVEDPIRTITQKPYRFLTEDLHEVNVPEGALIVDRLFPGQEILLKFVEEDVDNLPTKSYAVYLHRRQQKRKEHIGEIEVPDDTTITLATLRNALDTGELNLNDDDKSNCVFLTENLEDVNGPEEALLVDLLYPNQEVILRLQSDLKILEKPGKVEASLPKATDFKRKELAYVGPLGMCNAPECEKAARVKCLDCGQVGYCSTRHMREDTPVHRRTCFKPAWKI